MDPSLVKKRALRAAHLVDRLRVEGVEEMDVRLHRRVRIRDAILNGQHVGVHRELGEHRIHVVQIHGAKQRVDELHITRHLAEDV